VRAFNENPAKSPSSQKIGLRSCAWASRNGKGRLRATRLNESCISFEPEVEAEPLTRSLKAFGRIIFLATLATIGVLLGSFSPSLGFADMFQHSVHEKCGNQASMLQFSILSSDSTASGNRAFSGSCSFDYGISLSQTSASVVQGTNVSITVSVSLSRGVAGPVDLSLRQIPDGLKLGLNPSSGEPPFDSRLSLSAGPVSPIGSFTIIVMGSSPTAGVRSASLSLIVRQAVHDVAILDLKAPAAGKPGDLLDVNVTVASYGPFMETVEVQLLANNTRVLAVESLSVKSFSTSIVGLLWNTAGYPASTYELSAIALPVQGETNLENNSVGHAIVKLTERPTGPAPSSSLTGLGLGTEAVILVSLGEALLGLFIIGRRISGKPRKPVTKTKR